MGIQGAGTGSGIFILRKQSFQLGVLRGPAVLVRVKDIRQASPADIL